MGMDVYGIKPTSKLGEYFRASVWQWRPLNFMMEEAIERFSLGFDLEGFDFNDGAGLSSQNKCTKLANALEAILQETHCEFFTLDSDPIGDEASVLEKLRQAGWTIDTTPKLEGLSVVAPCAYRIDRSHVSEFITFLRHCGGFEIF